MAEREKTKDLGEGLEEITKQFHAQVRGFFPPDFTQHMIAARREFLLGVRSLIDSRIEKLEREERATTKKAKKVAIE